MDLGAEGVGVEAGQCGVPVGVNHEMRVGTLPVTQWGQPYSVAPGRIRVEGERMARLHERGTGVAGKGMVGVTPEGGGSHQAAAGLDL